MGHYCRMCGRTRANERFSGRSHRDHICKDCQGLPRAQRQQIDQLDELFGYLEQSNISEKNQQRLAILNRDGDAKVSAMASLVLEIARVKPHKRRRWKFLAKNHRDLFLRLKECYGGDLPDAFEFSDEDYELFYPEEEQSDQAVCPASG